MNRFLFAAVAMTAGLLASSARAALTTTPYLFTEQTTASTGQFEWDEFSGGATEINSPVGFSPDVAELGGAAALVTSDYTAQPFDGPPFALVTSTQNIYAGGTLVDFDVNLTGLDTTEAFTTVVLQLSAVGSFTPSSILLDGVAPSTLIDRGVKADVEHNADGGPGTGSTFDTRYYWAEWQVNAESDYLIEFTNAATHASLAQVRVDYFNGAATFTAAAAGAVPEPSTIALTALIACGVSAIGLRRRFDADASLS